MNRCYDCGAEWAQVHVCPQRTTHTTTDTPWPFTVAIHETKVDRVRRAVEDLRRLNVPESALAGVLAWLEQNGGGEIPSV